MVASTKNFIYNSASVVEFPLVILFSSLYCIQFWQGFASENHIHNAATLFLLGFLGSLSRTDFGLLPFSLVVVVLPLLIFLGEKKSKAVASFGGLAGAATGVLFAFAHSYLFTGDYLQSSAKMKAYWAQFYNIDYRGAIGLIKAILGLESRLTLTIVVLGAMILCLYIMLKRSRRISRSRKGLSVANLRAIKENKHRIKGITRELALLIASCCCVLGYVLFYSRSALIQPWYSANLIIPILLLSVVASTFIGQVLGDRFTAIGLSIIAALIIIGNFIDIYPINELNSPWPHQRALLTAGKYLAQQDFDGLVGRGMRGLLDIIKEAV